MSRRRLRQLALAGALACFGVATLSAAAGGQGTVVAPGSQGPAAAAQLAVRGRTLYAEGCASCHGTDLRGRPGTAPSLRGAGTAAADFYLSTGRMPLASPKDQPDRGPPAYDRADIDALVAFVGTFGGPAPPDVRSARGDVAHGLKAFTDHCAGCHQVVARGGIVTGAAVPALDKATDRQIGEAVRVGPYLMPAFSAREIDARTLDDIAAYLHYARRPDNAGGWSIGNIGPIPEGMVAWLLAGVVLLAVARLIGERSKA